MIYFTVLNCTISYLKPYKSLSFSIELCWQNGSFSKMTHWFYCQRFWDDQWRHSCCRRVRLGTSWAHNQIDSSSFFHSNQKICKRFHGNGIFCSSNRLVHKFESYITPNHILESSLLGKVELIRCFSLLVSRFFCLLLFIQVTNSAMAKTTLDFVSFQPWSRSIIFQVHAYFDMTCLVVL